MNTVVGEVPNIYGTVGFVSNSDLSAGGATVCLVRSSGHRDYDFTTGKFRSSDVTIGENNSVTIYTVFSSRHQNFSFPSMYRRLKSTRLIQCYERKQI